MPERRLDAPALRAFAYVSAVLALCVGGYAAILAFGASRMYCSHSVAFLDAVPCYRAAPSGQNADILLVGDSSLLYGISPARVAAAGGGSSYNLGTPGPGFSFAPEMLVDRYLAGNARPRAIILYFSPWTRMSRTRVTDPRWTQLGIFLLQHGRLSEIAAFLRALPSSIVELPPIILASVGARTGPAPAVAAQMAADHGHLDYAPWMPRALPAGCRRTASSPQPADNRAELAALRRRYLERGIPVFVYVAPIAACDGAIGAVRHVYTGVADNVPQALADPLFADDATGASHVHPSPAGTPVFSATLADFIRTVVQPRLAADANRSR